VREVTFRNKKRLRDKDTYTVAANSYMVSGGSGFSMLTGKPQVGESQGDLEVLELYLKRLPQPVPAPDTNRWQELK
jgi:2',3'-cyclic-nucleotide 2'-phosphodiesterase (5'-nucleotidase family)